MNRLLLLAGVLAFLGACSSGGGCDGGNDNRPAASGQSTGLPGGVSHGGTGETVSFQGLGRKGAGDPARPSQTAAAAAALGGSGAPAPAAPAASAEQSVICGGFPNLAADCKTDPAFPQVQKKCCASGQADRCQAIPGGARLIGRGCVATPDGPLNPPQN
ncbi:MAG TPA: hypothetical protein VH309_11505 [Elusimicrobiota bacterium]|nr:hypothetical protein [Elusimicrobiota bacterium]